MSQSGLEHRPENDPQVISHCPSAGSRFLTPTVRLIVPYLAHFVMCGPLVPTSEYLPGLLRHIGSLVVLPLKRDDVVERVEFHHGCELHLLAYNPPQQFN